jgi:hypothetical protein
MSGRLSSSSKAFFPAFANFPKSDQHSEHQPIRARQVENEDDKSLAKFIDLAG